MACMELRGSRPRRSECPFAHSALGCTEEGDAFAWAVEPRRTSSPVAGGQQTAIGGGHLIPSISKKFAS